MFESPFPVDPVHDDLRKRKVEAFGVDISEYAIEHVHVDIQPYCKVA